MKRLSSLLIILSLALILVACGDKDPDTLVMGFVPSQDSENIASNVEPLAKRLSEELGIEVKGEVMTNFNPLMVRSDLKM